MDLSHATCCGHYSTSLSSLPVWREDRLLFLRERASGAYGTHAYFTSMVCFDIFILRVIPPVFFTVRPVRCCSPRHKMPFYSRNKGSRCVD